MMVLKPWWYLLLLLAGVLMFQQNEYKVIFERVEVVRYNKSYINRLTTHNFKYNRTTAVVNISFDIAYAFGRDLKVEVQAYKLTSNEYRDFPVRFMFDYCDYVAKNEFGLGDLYKCGNLTKCPLQKGNYRVCNWALNSTKFPPHVPKGSYMLDLKFFYHDIEVFYFQPYATLKYPEVPGFSVF